MARKADGGWSVDLNTAAHNWQSPGTDPFRSRGGDRKSEMGLDQEVRNWSTPHGMMGHEADGSYGCGGEHAKEAQNWPTPKTVTGGAQSNRQERHARTGKMAGADLEEATQNWQAPQARDHRDGRIDPQTAAKHLGSRPLNEEVLNWQSPLARDHRDGRRKPETAARHLGSRQLNEEVLKWQTPTAQDCESAGSPKTTYLKQQVENWPAPRAEDSEFCGNHPGAQDSLTGVLQDWSPPSTSPPTEPETGTAGKTCWCGLHGCDLPSHRRKLNIYFDEWLMGWPLNWSSANIALTGFGPWATESARLLWQWLFAYSQKPMGLGVSGQMDLF